MEGLVIKSRQYILQACSIRVLVICIKIFSRIVGSIIICKRRRPYLRASVACVFSYLV